MSEIISKILEYTLVATVSYVVYLNKKIISLEKDNAVQDKELEYIRKKICEIELDNKSCLNYERNNKVK